MTDILIQTLMFGSELALIAVGLTLVFGISRFANIVQGDFATLGAYGTLLISSLVGGSLLLDGVVSIVVVGLLAVVLNRILFVRLLKRNTATAMIGSFALSILVRAVIQAITGPAPKALDLPLERGENIFGALVTPSQIGVVSLSLLVLAGLLLALRVTPIGRSIRAVSANPGLASAAGVDVRRVADIVWLIGGGLAALGGVVLAVDTQVSIGMGFQLLLPVLAAALIGSLGSAGGAIAASYLLAFASSLVLRIDFGPLFGSHSIYLATGYRPAVGFALLLVVLVVRPQGVFGRVARRA